MSATKVDANIQVASPTSNSEKVNSSEEGINPQKIQSLQLVKIRSKAAPSPPQDYIYQMSQPGTL
jgi:hypothetical protein